jgi:GNAT superfamily N-acetyltransferase
MRLKEFAPSPERDDNDDIPDQLVVLANRWWNATDRQPQIEHVLNSLGWSIHQVESEDDAVQLQHRDGTTYFISADDFDPDLFEISDELRRSYLNRAGKVVDRRMDHMARVRDRLNKGYEIYHADRPAGSTQIVDRFEADTPALARQYYEKFIQGYESDVDFDLRLRRATGIMEEPLNELGNAPAEYQPNRKRKRSLFHATVDGHWVDVFFDRSELNDTLHITFAVDGNYEASDQPTKASKSTVKILSTVLNIVKQKLPEYIAKARPPAVSFTSKEDNRSGLYRKYFVPVIQNILGSKWAHEEFPSMNMTVFNWKPVEQIKEIARIPQGDFGDADTLKSPKYDVEKKELPGGAGFTYAVGKTGTGDIEIMIFDGDTLAAELDLFATQDVTGAWRVNTVAVNPEYRSRGLGKALYGIALSILKLTIEAGDTQTQHGQRMWLMLNSIPGVEVLGYNMERTEKYKPHPSDDIVAQDNTWTRYTFPVKPGVNSMRSARRGTGMYTSQASMLAKWTGK